nr:rhomboid-like protein [Mycobacterium sp. 360MFTsu5.1]
MSRVLSSLAMVRFTATYAVVLLVVAATLAVVGPQVQGRVIDHLSTNLHNLARGHLDTLIGSAFVTADNDIYAWLPGLVCLLALGELLWRGKGVVVAFTLGHIGATLIVAAVLAIAILAGWLPPSIADASDVGISYGAAAILGALTAAMPAWWRLPWVSFWLTDAVVVATAPESFDFSAAGHVIALTLGIALSTRLRVPTRWTPPRLLLLAGGVAFGYSALIGFGAKCTPAIGFAAALFALVARSATRSSTADKRQRLSVLVRPTRQSRCTEKRFVLARHVPCLMDELQPIAVDIGDVRRVVTGCKVGAVGRRSLVDAAGPDGCSIGGVNGVGAVAHDAEVEPRLAAVALTQPDTGADARTGYVRGVADAKEIGHIDGT